MFDWNVLEEKLKHHDYTYMMSDDHTYWVAGEQSYEEIEKLIQKAMILDKQKTKELILKYKKEFGSNFLNVLGDN